MSDKNISRLRNGLQVDGRSEVIGAETVNVMFKDANENVVLCSGTTVPTADTAGYAKGCLFIKTDAGDGTKGLYENQGTTLLSDFNLVGAITSGEIADDAITTAKILNANVTKAKLATGILASHIVKFFALGSTITGTTLTGVAVGDLVVTILADGTVTVGTVAVADTLPADPADTSYVIVFRATA